MEFGQDSSRRLPTINAEAASWQPTAAQITVASISVFPWRQGRTYSSRKALGTLFGQIQCNFPRITVIDPLGRLYMLSGLGGMVVFLFSLGVLQY
jgi:hypothetical protein